MSILKTKIIPDTDYNGEQLSPHWIYRQTKISGNTLIAFEGTADVSLDHMVDLEDVEKKAPIYSPRMLHFLGEFFIDSLETAIAYQHLLVFHLYEALVKQIGAQDFTRRGNDLYWKNRKASVSIATKSPVSVLVHLGVNIETENTPIPTSGLKEMGIDPKALGAAILETFHQDYEIWARARVKVLPR